VNLLIDTHVLLWLLAGSPRLSGHVLATLANRRNGVFLSVVSTWEIAIKAGLGKLDLPPNLHTWLPDELDAAGLKLLPIDLKHSLGVESLPQHHRDPFDRLLIAQAVSDGLTIVTADQVFDFYDVPLLRVE
jgi:PIN domain nuclease of toxin-antitoxin system